MGLCECESESEIERACCISMERGYRSLIEDCAAGDPSQSVE